MLLVSLLSTLLSLASATLPASLSEGVTTETVSVSYPRFRNWPSDAWRPAIYTSCFGGLHNESAPCRRIPNLIHAEELIYPDFRLKLPRFVSAEHKDIFLKVMKNSVHVWLRGRIIGNYAYFLNQRGQNLVYANVSYVGRPTPGHWADDACLSYNSHHHVTSFPAWVGTEDAPSGVFVASPDDNSFQHFTDRVAVMLAQTRHLGDPAKWKYITSPIPLNTPAFKLWSLLIPNFTHDQHLLSAYTFDLRMRLFLYPCQTPLIHPYTHQLSSELYQQAAGFDPGLVESLSARPVVLFLTRRSASRAWANEEECRTSLDALLGSRGKGEQLLVFDAANYPAYQDVVALGHRVKMLVGAHGGAFNNIVFMLPGTTVVEICPVSADHANSRCGTMMWELASVRRMPYWMIPADQTTPDWQVTHLDCSLVVAAVRGALEEADGYGAADDPLESFHQGSSFGR